MTVMARPGRPTIDLWLFRVPVSPGVLALFTGAFGVLISYALFLLWWKQQSSDAHPWTEAAALAAATVVALVIEGLRDLIGRKDTERHHEWSLPRIISTVLMILFFELFVMAAHKFPELAHGSKEIGSVVLGPGLSKDTPAGWHVGALAGLWVLAGAVLTFSLSRIVTRPNLSLPRRLFSAVRVACLASALWAPLTAVGWILVARIAAAGYQAAAAGLGDKASLASMAGLVLQDGSGFVALSGLVALVWLGPSVLIGMTVPFMKDPSTHRRFWIWISMGAGVLLLLSVLWWRLLAPWFLVLLVPLLWGSFWFRRETTEIEEYAGLVALAIALFMFGGTHGAQTLSTRLLGAVHEVYLLPLPPAAEAAGPADEVGSVRALLRQRSAEQELGLPVDEGYLQFSRHYGLELPPVRDLGAPSRPPRAYVEPVLPPVPGETAIQREAGRARLGRKPTAETRLADLDEDLERAQMRETAVERGHERLGTRRAERTGLRAALDAQSKDVQAIEAGPLYGRQGRLADVSPKLDTLIESVTGAQQRTTTELRAFRDRWPPRGRVIEAGETNAVKRSRALVDAAFGRIEPRRVELVKGLEEEAGELNQLAVAAKKIRDEQLPAMRRYLRGVVNRYLEFAMTASLGFWLTLGLMAGWSIVKDDDTLEDEVIERAP